MKSTLFLVVAVLGGLLFTPALMSAQAGTTSENPPISQPLVREGTMAIRLAEAFDVGTTANETEAESLLGAAGIAPRNGWIADYPLTPDIIGELQQAIGEAADSGRITMRRDEALEVFQRVTGEFNLSVRAYTPDQPVQDMTAYENYPNPTAIDGYYSAEGPPVVTYYAPPADYYYLYTWVPYPFWWWSAWFPGFFVLADFDVHVNKHGRHHDGDHLGRREIVSNHFRDSTGRMSRIDAASRVFGGTFRDSGGRGWASPSAQSGAQAILNAGSPAAAGRSGMSTPVTGSSVTGSQTTIRGTAVPFSGGGRSFSAPSVGRGSGYRSENRVFSGHSVQQRTYVASSAGGRTFNPAASVGRSFSSPIGGGRTFSGGGTGSFGSWRR